ncbi:MAG TPA: hypothetical protein VMJ12_01000 [Candidatus Acidoferrales bacterium]|nr:hypothetical protein [Candidatus Acidoferrales bacterium]
MAELPSWLRAPDVAGDYARGLQIGASVREAKARLAQEQQEFAIRTQIQSQQNQQQHNLEQQRIAVANAYRQEQIALRQQQLDEVKAVNDQKTANAARQFAARQEWQKGFAAIDADPTKTDAEKDAAKTSFTMRLAPMMGMPGTEAASMLRDMRPAKPVVPSSVEDEGDFLKITNPNTGGVTFHNKPKEASAGPDNVKVQLQLETPPVTMPRKQAMATIPNLPPELQTNAVNKAVMSGASEVAGKKRFRYDPDKQELVPLD